MDEKKNAAPENQGGSQDIFKRMEEVHKRMDEWAKKEKGSASYADWYADRAD